MTIPPELELEALGGERRNIRRHVNADLPAFESRQEHACRAPWVLSP